MSNSERTSLSQKKDEAYVWHAMKPYNPTNTLIAKEAKGVWVTDEEGNRYLDAMSGLWCVNIGYGREELAKAAYEQMKHLAYFPLTHSHNPAIELAEKLNELLGGDYVLFYSNSGSEANEVAFKIARQYHQQKGELNRYKIISRYRSYHGNTMGALAATGQAQRKYKYEPLTTGFLHVPPPDTYRSPVDPAKSGRERDEVKAIEQMITWELEETVAAVIMEPIITGGGILMPPDDYLQSVQEVCREKGALFIVDEVICGFGRTGEPFGFMNYGVKPDIITMAKGVTSAYLPLSVTAVKKEIYDTFKGSEEYDYFRHVNTFGGNPAACAVALKNLEIMEEEGLFTRAKTVGDQMLEQLRAKLLSHPKVGDVRGKGLLIGVEFVTDKVSKVPLPVEFLNKIIASCKEKGIIIGKNGATVAGYNNVLTIAPPLIINDDEVNLVVNAIVDSVQELSY
ncbi:aspartate aminotransferase family protein [Alkalihalobacillus sp. MEB130]|uniref:aspartate aminotransferase family protein n=1 Tax=Alkalihalobacillus sp. MEB130 TaxID=2976704 RepID=UPI0028DFFFC9|nr:aspartate aminotransferase family protein [Alkalihalobacillus sp. MEB130]MDT8860910.1 aspartate aminotransferase family protein [Alkalihalobacillus sp. MEB130]